MRNDDIIPSFKEGKSYWVVWTNTDLTEGRGLEYIKYHCLLESTAKRLAKGSYVMGTDSRVTVEKSYIIDGIPYYKCPLIIHPSIEDKQLEEKFIAERNKEERKKAVLKKAKDLGLTDEEIGLLK